MENKKNTHNENASWSKEINLIFYTLLDSMRFKKATRSITKDRHKSCTLFPLIAWVSLRNDNTTAKLKI